MGNMTKGPSVGLASYLHVGLRWRKELKMELSSGTWLNGHIVFLLEEMRGICLGGTWDGKSWVLLGSTLKVPVIVQLVIGEEVESKGGGWWPVIRVGVIRERMGLKQPAD